MVTRLVEASYFASRDAPTPAQVLFWLREMRTAELLVEVARRFPEETATVRSGRPLVEAAAAGDVASLRAALRAEEDEEREADRQHWLPLREQLERLRRERPRG